MSRRGPTFQNPGGGPEQLLVVVGSHDPDQLKGTLAGQDDQLGLLISVGQDLETVGDNGQELDIVPLQKGDHLGDAPGQPYSVLGALLVEEQVVQGGDGVEENALDG